MKRYRQTYKRAWIAAKRSLYTASNDYHDYPKTSSSESSDIDESTVEKTATQTDRLLFESNFVYENDSDIHDNVNQRNLVVYQVPAACRTADDDDPWKAIDDYHYLLTSDDSSDCEGISDFKADMRQWATKYLIKQNAIDALLKLEKKHGRSDLPSCARTLLGTAQNIETTQISGMDYVYFGIKEELCKILQNYDPKLIDTCNSFELSMNVDGIPLFKSSSASLWPILCSIMNLKPVKVFAIAICYGQSKPDDLLFLQDTVHEMSSLLRDGLTWMGRIICIKLNCIVCDAPARAMIKATKLFSGYYGCDKCNQRGEWHGRMTYPKVNNIKCRTDVSFRSQKNEEHHKAVSPLCNLPIDMVTTFPIDYMHQVCLGTMKRLLLTWMRCGKRDLRLSALQIEEISNRLLHIKKYIPDLFARKPRGLNEVDRWKATEFRQFLLYTGKIALKGILRNDLYRHFLCLNVAISILVSPKLCLLHSKYAENLLKYFVLKSSELYGKEFIVYNIHSLIHLSKDAEKFGCLDECSAFAFENYLQRLKKLVRNGKRPVVQIAKRLGEQEINYQKKENNSPLLIAYKKPNNAYILNNNSCCEILHSPNAQGFVRCRVYNRTSPIFHQPCDSRLVGMFSVNEKQSRIKMMSCVSVLQQAIFVGGNNGKPGMCLAILHQQLE
jgi:hypothetical protein